MQHHFVVVYDSKTDAFEIDDDTTQARFDEGVIWDPATETWRNPEGALEKKDQAARARLADALDMA